MTNLVPSKNCALVELIDKYGEIATLQTKYNEMVNGKCLKVGDEEYSHLLDKVVYWELFKAGEIIEKENKKYSFILLEDIRGYETD